MGVSLCDAGLVANEMDSDTHDLRDLRKMNVFWIWAIVQEPHIKKSILRDFRG